MENRYEKYKDSGIAWIGNIPEHWEVKKLGHLYIPRNEKVSDKDYPALSVTMQGVLLQLENVAKTNDGDNRKLVKIGDFAINSRSDRRGSCGISKYDGSVSLINIVLTPINDMNPVYYEWLFHSSLFSDEYYRWGHGIVNDLWTTRWQEMKNIQIAAPPLHEQQLIATYLDQKCSEIDELITLQEEMITKLQSYKQSVITEAVTKGLDKNVPLKDSGIEWIGEIPEHWEVKRLKNVCSQINIKENSKENSLPYIGLENIESGSGRYIDTTSEVEGMANRFCKNNVLFGKLRPYLSKVYLAEKDGICSTEFIVYDTKSNNCRFIHKLLLSQAFIEVVNSSTYGAKMPRANSDFINNIYVQIPPLSEQQSIANYLDQKCSEIDELISIKQQKIEKLKDYKKSLIFECVTGKRKV